MAGMRIFIFGLIVTTSQGIAVYIAWKFGDFYGFAFDFVVVAIAVFWYYSLINRGKIPKSNRKSGLDYKKKK